MAINPNEDLTNNHCGFVGSSGSGKTYKVKQLISSKPDANVLVYDQFEVYGDCLQYAKTIKELGGLIRAAISAGKPFRFAFSGTESDAFERFSKLAWISASGDSETIVVFEEAGGYLDNSAKTSGYWYKLITVGRKYGVMVVPVTQRPQTVNKNIYDMLNKIWVGFSTGRSRAYLEKDFGCDLLKIGPNEYKYYLVNDGQAVLYDRNDKAIK